MRFCARFNADYEKLRLALGDSLQWSSQCRYRDFARQSLVNYILV